MRNSYLKSKEGGFVIAFILIMIAFAMILIGVNNDGELLYIIGFISILCAMIYAPIRKYIIDRQ